MRLIALGCGGRVLSFLVTTLTPGYCLSILTIAEKTSTRTAKISLNLSSQNLLWEGEKLVGNSLNSCSTWRDNRTSPRHKIKVMTIQHTAQPNCNYSYITVKLYTYTFKVIVYLDFFNSLSVLEYWTDYIYCILTIDIWSHH